MRMRGDLGLQLRLLRRPEGALGLIVAVAGATAAAAAYLPWYEVTAKVTMLGESSGRPVAQLDGWQAHPWAWLVPAVALVVIAIGVLLAVDHPVANTSDALLVGGMAIALGVAVAGRWFPAVARFEVGGSSLREMVDMAHRLPRDVELAFAVSPGVGMWLALAASAVLLAAGLTARGLR